MKKDNSYFDKLDREYLYVAHARLIARALVSGSEKYFKGWLQDFPELLKILTEAEARRAFKYWRSQPRWDRK
jgi:hypothetical protein